MDVTVLLAKLHPAIVHFPIALIFSAVFFEFARRRRPGAEFRPAAFSLYSIFPAAISACVAATTGTLDAAIAGHGGNNAVILGQHEFLGIASAVAAGCAAFSALAAFRVTGSRRFYIYRGTLVCAVLLTTLAGHQGAKLIYGEDYFTAPGNTNGPATMPAAGPARGRIAFETQVLPILIKRCYSCHTGVKPESEFSLDSPAAALRGGSSGKVAIVPGHPETSYLYHLISGGAPPLVMPPRGAALSAGEVATIRRWIEEGAVFATGGPSAPGEHWHWAYRRPVRPAIPDVKDRFWPRNEIDYFILRAMEDAGFSPAPPAAPETLLRRVSLDLTGLPPSIEALDAFLHDSGGDAYERAVDRLLASPAFGERWARPWLDIARFADTQGYEKDARRSMWPWRDWVIDALNRDMPFDQFTIEQLAGDLLPGATVDQQIATGFHRNTMINEEGGVDPEEFRLDAVLDRANTTASAWLGSTFACAQCHDHKFDPVSIKEYYQFAAFFNNTEDEVDHSGYESRANKKTTLRIPVRERRAEFDTLTREIQTLEGAIKQLDGSAGEMPDAWAREKARLLESWVSLVPSHVSATGGARFIVDGAGVATASGPMADVDQYRVEFTNLPVEIHAIRIDVLPVDENGGPRLGRAKHGNFVISEVRAALDAGAEKDLVFKSAAADYEQDATFGGDAGWPAARAVDGVSDSEGGWAVGGAVDRPHTIVCFLTEPARPAPGAKLILNIDQKYGQHPVARFQVKVATTQDLLTVAPPGPDIEPFLNTSRGQRSQAVREKLDLWYVHEVSGKRAVSEKLKKAQASRDRIPAGETYVMRERKERRQTYIHIGGNFLNRGAAVEPAVPAVFEAVQPAGGMNRLALARWLVDGRNPLVARVQINRWWSLIFGRGIVETEEDFGTRGDEPAHAALLDWLATELPRRGWSMKSILRTIVTSSTYRQDSVRSPAAAEKDPYNILLTYAPRLRLEAEMLRDNALAIAGLLVPRVGGPSVFPPQPDGLWTMIYNADQWVNDRGDSRYRRGIYTFWRRTVAYPTFTTFDAPSRETSCMRRPRTNTPLQALTTLNDPQFFESAVALAERMHAASGDVRARISTGFRMATARVPRAQELAKLEELYQKQRTRFEASPALASEVRKSRPGSGAKEPHPAEIAAMTLVANVILNLDETLTRN